MPKPKTIFPAPALLALVALATLAAPSSGAESARMISATGDDLVVDRIETRAAPIEAPLGAPDPTAVERQPIAVSWPLDPNRTIDPSPRPFVAESRSYSLRVSADELRRGVTVPTVGPAAVVRLVPVDGAATEALDPMAITVVDPAGHEHPAGAAIRLPAAAETLRATGVPFADGTSAFRLAEELGAGAFVLRAPSLDPDASEVLVHVFEPESGLVLELTTARDAWLRGERLRAVAELRGGPGAELGELQAFVVAPSGERTPASVRLAGPSRIEIGAPLDSRESMADGFWQLVVRAQGRWNGLSLRRDGHTSFGFAVPTARLTGQVGLVGGFDGLAVEVGVEAGVEGRYEIRGILFGTDAAGSLRPLGTGHSAAWLAAGAGALELRFDREVLESAPLGVPFEVRDLRLMDQRRLGLLHRQARAIRVE